MKKHAKLISVICLIGCVLVLVLGAVFHDDSSRIARNMKGHYYVGYVNKKARYLYFGDDHKVAMGIKKRDAMLMTVSYSYQVKKKKDYYELTFHAHHYRLQLDNNKLPSRLFALDHSENYMLKDK